MTIIPVNNLALRVNGDEYEVFAMYATKEEDFFSIVMDGKIHWLDADGKDVILISRVDQARERFEIIS